MDNIIVWKIFFYMRPEKISKAFNKSISANSYIPEMFFADLKFIRLTKFPQSSKGLSINLWCSRRVDNHLLVGSARKVLSYSPPKAWNLYKGPRRWTLLPQFRQQNPPSNTCTGSGGVSISCHSNQINVSSHKRGRDRHRSPSPSSSPRG